MSQGVVLLLLYICGMTYFTVHLCLSNYQAVISPPVGSHAGHAEESGRVEAATTGDVSQLCQRVLFLGSLLLRLAPSTFSLRRQRPSLIAGPPRPSSILCSFQLRLLTRPGQPAFSLRRLPFLPKQNTNSQSNHGYRSKQRNTPYELQWRKGLVLLG